MSEKMIPDQVAVDRKIDALAKKRDYAADVMNNPMLALTYQQEIDRLLEHPSAPPPPESDR